MKTIDQLRMSASRLRCRGRLAFERFEPRVVLSATNAAVDFTPDDFTLTLVAAPEVKIATVKSGFIALDFADSRALNNGSAVDFEASLGGLDQQLHFNSIDAAGKDAVFELSGQGELQGAGDFVKIPTFEPAEGSGETGFVEISQIGLRRPENEAAAPASDPAESIAEAGTRDRSPAERSTQESGGSVENSRGRAVLFELAANTVKHRRGDDASDYTAQHVAFDAATIGANADAEAVRRVRFDAAIEQLYRPGAPATTPARAVAAAAESWGQNADRWHGLGTSHSVELPRESSTTQQPASVAEPAATGKDNAEIDFDESTTSPTTQSDSPVTPIAANRQARRTESRHDYAIGAALVAMLSADHYLRRLSAPRRDQSAEVAARRTRSASALDRLTP